MNKKALTVLAILILFCTSASAQKVRATFGITGGGIATQMMTDPAPSSPLYFSGYGGAFSNISFKKVIGLKVGANYQIQGGKYLESETYMTAQQQYLQIPVALQLNLKSFFTLEAGFYQNILLSSKFTEEGNTTVVITPDPGAHKYNFGVLAGMSINFGRFVFLNLRYHYGLSNAYIIRGNAYPQGIITAGLGFNIISTRKSAF